MQTTVNDIKDMAKSGKENGKEGYQRAKASGSRMVSNVSNEFRDFVADIEDLVEATTSLSGEDLWEAKRRLDDRVQQAKQSMEEVGENVIERARRGAAVTNDYVHDQPWMAIGLGAATGLLVGFLLARRS